MVLLVSGFNQHVVDVNFHRFPELVGEHSVHQSLVGSSNIFQTKRHYFIAVSALVGNESHFFLTSGRISIWLYPENASMKDNSSCPAVALISRSICGSGKLSLGHALFKSVMSMHTLHFPFFFLTTTGLAS